METFAKQSWTLQETARLIAAFESERRFYEEAVTALPVPVATVAGDGTLLSANQAFFREFPIEREELDRKSLAAIFGDMFWQHALMPHEPGTLVVGNYTAHFTPIHRWERGETEWSVLFLERQHQNARMAGQAGPTDPELIASRASVEAAQRLARRINHEINNQAMIAAGYGGELLARLPTESPLREDVSMLMGATARIENLAVQLGEYARTGRSEIAAHALREVLPPSGYRIGGGTGDVTVATDRMALMNVLAALSLIAPGPLTLEVVVADYDLILTVSGFADSAEILQRHLEPLNKAALEEQAGARECTRIGPNLIQAGIWWKVTEAGRLELHLPRAPGSGGTRRSALVVDDQSGIRAIIRRVLETHGFSVEDAASGEEAAALLERRNGAFDLLVTDMRMPGMSGRELADRFRVRHPSARILFISGFTNDPNVQSGTFPERSGFLPKPFHPDQLIDAVSKLLE